MDVVIVGPFTSEMRDAEWLETIGQRFQAPIEIHYVTCNPEERRRRMQLRNESRDASKLADWANHLAYYENEPRPAFEHRFVDTSSD